MIKKWNQFNESKAEKPGQNVPGSVKITISDEEVNSFSDEPALSKLIYDDKVSLLGNEVWYLENDDQTKAILDQYLEVPGKNELEEITENTSSDDIVFSGVIDKLAKYHLQRRYYNYMGGDYQWSTSTNDDARVLNIVYDKPEAEIKQMIESRIKEMCEEKGWRNFSDIRN